MNLHISIATITSFVLLILLVFVAYKLYKLDIIARRLSIKILKESRAEMKEYMTLSKNLLSLERQLTEHLAGCRDSLVHGNEAIVDNLQKMHDNIITSIALLRPDIDNLDSIKSSLDHIQTQIVQAHPEIKQTRR
jgi:CHASE3 domain sensor protein